MRGESSGLRALGTPVDGRALLRTVGVTLRLAHYLRDHADPQCHLCRKCRRDV